MRSLTLPIVLLALLSLPVAASAQPTLYVCTPSGQILTVDGTSGQSSALPLPTFSALHDCVVGPDDAVYAASGKNILRVNLADNSYSFLKVDQLGNPVDLAFTPKSLAFNVSTLYITVDESAQGNKTTGAVYSWKGTPNGTTNTGGPLTFSGTPTRLFSIGSPARGVVFDVVGNMVLASDSKLQRSLPTVPVPSTGVSYNTPTTLAEPSTITPVGVAINTCKDIVYADAASQSIRLVGSEDPLVTFTGKDMPLFLEIDSSNVMYVVTGEKLDGSAAKVWRADFDFAACSLSSLTQLVSLKDQPQGSDLPSSAIGIAVAATNKLLTKTYSASHCNDEYDFGYHRVTLEFTDCATTFGTTSADITVEALKKTLSDTTFDTSDASFDKTPRPIEGMRYSAMGGFVVQYLMTSSPNPAPGPVRLIYHFDTQEFILAPGVAKVAGTDPDADFNKSVGTDYWEAGKLDPPAGERGDTCCSKHVVFNAGQATASQCFFSFDEPLKSQNPLFNGSQTISVSGTARNGGFKCDGGILRLSIFRAVFPQGQAATCANLANANDAVFLNVLSSGNAQFDNIMDAAGAGKYKFNLDSSSFEPGVHVLTIQGPLLTAATTIGSLNIASATKCIEYQR
jgi:hypothetical protein